MGGAPDSLIFSIFLIFVGAAALATLALYARQSLLVAYILLGALLGPSGANLVPDPAFFEQTAHIGIMFLLFLLGLDLKPQELLHTLKQSTALTVLSSGLFAAVGLVLALGFGFPLRDSLVVGAVAMFSSTIIGVKLLPTTTLHHAHTGGIVISILLLQDLLAIVILLLLEGYGRGGAVVTELLLVAAYLPGMILFGFVFSRYLLIRVIRKFDKIQEYIFLVAVAWCLGMAELSESLGLSAEIGAFIAGVALASNPIALFIVLNLKPLRDFFLVMFFFALGAGLKPEHVWEVAVPGVLLAGLLLLLKPWVFRFLLLRQGERPALGMEIGVRLGQISEFGFLIGLLALESSFIANRTFYLIEVAILVSFVISSFWVVQRYPTPIAMSDRLRRD